MYDFEVMDIKSLEEAKVHIDEAIKWCNDHQAYAYAESMEVYLAAIRMLAARAVEHIIDIDFDYVRANFDGWDEYLMEEFGVSYEDFKTLTCCELADVFKSAQKEEEK